MPYVFEPLDPSRHDRAAFSSGEPAIDTYLKQQARQDIDRDLAYTFVLCEPGKSGIIGYYTITPVSVVTSELPEEVAKSAGRYRGVPAALIGRMGGDSTYGGQGIGGHILMDALRRSMRARQESGIVFKLVVVDALNPQVVDFYLHFGFRRFDDQPLKLYMPMSYVRALFPSEAPPP